MRSAPMRAWIFQRHHGRDKGVHIIAGLGHDRPIGMAVVLKRRSLGKHIFKFAGPVRANPSAAMLVGDQPVRHSAIRCFLQVEIERGLDFESRLMHFFGAEAFFQFAPHFFLEPWSHRHLRLRDAQA